ncbi:putative ribonuclease H-like domain-containing protein [Tanacetum coccineum]
MEHPNKYQLKFHSYQDAKLLIEAIEKSSESMDQTFDRLQKLIGQLEIQGEVINQEDMNLKLLRSLPSEWKYHALIWRNKAEIETISLDDLYNNLKIYEPELTGSSSTSQNTQNVAFVSNSTNNTNNTHKADDTAHEVSTTHSTTHTQHNGVNSICLDNLCDAVICAFLASQPNSPQLSQEDLEQLHPDDLEEMDLQWEMAMLTIRARRFIKRTGKKLDINGQRVGFDKSKVECFNCHKHIHFARECSYQAEEEQPINHALMAFTSSGSSSSSNSEVDSQFNFLSYKAARLRDNALNEYKMNLEKAEKDRDQLKQTLEKFLLGLKRLHGFFEVTAAQVHNGNYAKCFDLRNFDLEDMEFESTNSGTTSKIPILKLVPQTTQENGTSVTKMSIPVTAKEKTNKKNDVKAKGLLLMTLPNEHQLTFSQYPDAKSMFAIIETIFGGNRPRKLKKHS